MSKTLEEQAAEFSKFEATFGVGSDLLSYRQGLFEGYIYGYKAAQDQFRSTTGEAGDKLTPTDWISVKDRLPKIDQWCSWWDISGAAEPCTAFRGEDDIEMWWENYTHWMPLPASPKEEK